MEEQPRKLEHVVKIAHACINPQEPALDTKSNVSAGCGFDMQRVTVDSRWPISIHPSTHPTLWIHAFVSRNNWSFFTGIPAAGTGTCRTWNCSVTNTGWVVRFHIHHAVDISDILSCFQPWKLLCWPMPFIWFVGFEITIDHPHTDVVRCSQLVRGMEPFSLPIITQSYFAACILRTFLSFFTASKDLAQTSYFMATNRLLSCSHYCTVMAHYSFLSCRGPVSVSNALLAPRCWEPTRVGTYRLGCCVRCIVQGLWVGT